MTISTAAVASDVVSLRSPILDFSPEDILVIAHRGSSVNAPENSLSAIREAAALGVGMVEIDARQAADGQLLVIHDEEDPVVGFDQGKALADLAPRGSIVRTQGLGHRAILRAPQIVDMVTRFVDEEPAGPSFAATLDGELFVRDTRW